MEAAAVFSRQQYLVGISDMKYASGDADITTYALGSCVGISFYDPARQAGALLHVLLPEKGSSKDTNVMKFADSGIDATWKILQRQGFRPESTIVKIAGGARMFAVAKQSMIGDIGERNVQKVRENLAARGLRISAEDVGGEVARTMSLDLRNGDVTIRPAGLPEKHL